jgi:dihydroorotase
MAQIGMPLLIHGEVTDPEIDIFDREAVFLDRVLDPLRRRLPELRIVLEHITTEEAVQYVLAAGANLAATITAHHLSFNRNLIFAGGIRPHLYCLPVAKREKHRQALRRAAISGDPHFFLETYAEVFEECAALDRFEAFASLNGPEFYNLPPNEARVTLRCEPFPVPKQIGEGDIAIVPFRAGETLRWRLAT